MPSLVSTASVDIPLPLDLNVVTSQNGQNGMGENQWSPFSTLRADLDMNNGPLPAAGPSTARLPLAELSGPRQKRSRVDDRVSPGSPSSQDHMERVERADRLKRAADGRLRHYGPISIWSQKHSDAGQFGDSPPPDLVAPPTSWASNLPPELFIDQATHDLAMERFSAYYAPWCVVADMPGFTADLDLICKDPLAPWRTMVYSPLLHCTSLFLGLCLLHRQPTRETWDLFQHHCLNLLRRECANMTISTLLAINLLSSCMHFDAEVGYLYFGMAVAAVQTVSSRVRNRSRSYVERGEMTSGEQSARDTAMGTLYLQDVLRAVGFGRSPMFPASYAGVLPPIDASMDAEPWLLPSDLVATTNPAIRRLAGLPSTRSTVLHWTARLGVILRAVIDNLSMQQRSDDDSQAVEVQITFGAASIFLLNEVGANLSVGEGRTTVECIDSCLELLRRQATTWSTPDNALEVLLHLKSEWLPSVNEQGDLATGMTNDNHDLLGQLSAKDFEELLSTFDFRF
ncbi:hypothetical protein I316_06410 [Kwoniella heveanensis BCC8398]|uniref:Transcription factor domain-containing protein n=1 Tax=Kwoniella heveanensis BCC8398 TaxID=1296120 RepID=A0A1B9GLQ4_9TREE|nr:hypothetical protein I316_06410 [Kwoniella heveanensis BCC8398]